MFSFDLSSLKILSLNFQHFLIFCSQQYGQQMEKNIGKSLVAFSIKFHLKIAKFQILPILWRRVDYPENLGRFCANLGVALEASGQGSIPSLPMASPLRRRQTK